MQYNEAFEQGFESYLQGFTIEDSCPYGVFEDAWLDWHNGREMAKQREELQEYLQLRMGEP